MKAIVLSYGALIALLLCFAIVLGLLLWGLPFDIRLLMLLPPSLIIGYALVLLEKVVRKRCEVADRLKVTPVRMRLSRGLFLTSYLTIR